MQWPQRRGACSGGGVGQDGGGGDRGSTVLHWHARCGRREGERKGGGKRGRNGEVINVWCISKYIHLHDKALHTHIHTI